MIKKICVFFCLVFFLFSEKGFSQWGGLAYNVSDYLINWGEGNHLLFDRVRKETVPDLPILLNPSNPNDLTLPQPNRFETPNALWNSLFNHCVASRPSRYRYILYVDVENGCDETCYLEDMSSEETCGCEGAEYSRDSFKDQISSERLPNGEFLTEECSSGDVSSHVDLTSRRGWHPSHPYKTINKAIVEAARVRGENSSVYVAILVAEGVYYPTEEDPRIIRLDLRNKSKIHVFGGFPSGFVGLFDPVGDLPVEQRRDIIRWPTILDGNLPVEEGMGSTGVFVQYAESCMIDGVYIRNCKPIYSGQDVFSGGSAVSVLNGGGFVLSNSIIFNNKSFHVGAVSIHRANALIKNCYITENESWRGAGLSVVNYSQVNLERTTIFNNKIHLTDLSFASGGGGVFVGFGSALVCDSSYIVRNTSRGRGGGVEALFGSYAWFSNTAIAQNQVSFNEQIQGNNCNDFEGGWFWAIKKPFGMRGSCASGDNFNAATGMFLYGSEWRAPALPNDFVRGTGGGGISVGFESKIDLVFSVVFDNTVSPCGSGGGVFAWAESDVRTRSSVIYGNRRRISGSAFFFDNDFDIVDQCCNPWVDDREESYWPINKVYFPMDFWTSTFEGNDFLVTDPYDLFFYVHGSGDYEDDRNMYEVLPNNLGFYNPFGGANSGVMLNPETNPRSLPLPDYRISPYSFLKNKGRVSPSPYLRDYLQEPMQVPRPWGGKNAWGTVSYLPGASVSNNTWWKRNSLSRFSRMGDFVDWDITGEVVRLNNSTSIGLHDPALPEPTETGLPTATPTDTVFVPATYTPLPTDTNTPIISPTPSPTHTPVPTATNTPWPTFSGENVLEANLIKDLYIGSANRSKLKPGVKTDNDVYLFSKTVFEKPLLINDLKKFRVRITSDNIKGKIRDLQVIAVLITYEKITY